MTTQADAYEDVARLCAASVRALTGRPGLHVRAGALYDGDRRVQAAAPYLRTRWGEDDGRSVRGAADGLALRLLHSDPDLHTGLRPDDAVARLVFELLEQFRVESLAAMPGMAHNLRHRFETWSAQFEASGLAETGTGLLVFTVAHVCRARVLAEPVVADAEDLMEATRFGLAPLLGDDLALLRPNRQDQQAYAEPARRIADLVAQLVAAEEGTGTAPDDLLTTSRFSLALDEADALDDDGGRSATSGRVGSTTPGRDYAVFTREWDREVRAGTLVRTAQRAELRARLDALVEQSGVAVVHLARLLHALAGDERPAGWDAAQEGGLVDPGRLSRLVTSPSDARVFRLPRTEPSADAHLTLLLDCSGSMRRHQEALLTLVDLLVRACDLAGVPTEVLGFTTGAWNGGRAIEAWRRAGRPRRPGRLNERLHLVAKEPDTPWRRARHDIAALLRADVHREAIDGEAVEWAADRLRRRDARRRLLLVLSDGSPMDGATVQTNDPGYLDRHLVGVVDRITSAGDVVLTGVGVGTDVDGYYPHAHRIDLDDGVGRRLVLDVVGMITEAYRRRRSW